MIVRLSLIVCAVLGLMLWGCRAEPDLQGDWEGVMVTSGGPSFYYTLTLEEAVGEEITGSGGISVYTREGASADSTWQLEVQGVYRHPRLSLTITGPFPSVSGQVPAEFRGEISADGRKIEGTLMSAVTGEVELDLERVVRG